MVGKTVKRHQELHFHAVVWASKHIVFCASGFALRPLLVSGHYSGVCVCVCVLTSWRPRVYCLSFPVVLLNTWGLPVPWSCLLLVCCVAQLCRWRKWAATWLRCQSFACTTFLTCSFTGHDLLLSLCLRVGSWSFHFFSETSTVSQLYHPHWRPTLFSPSHLFQSSNWLFYSICTVMISLLFNLFQCTILRLQSLFAKCKGSTCCHLCFSDTGAASVLTGLDLRAVVLGNTG